MSLTNLMNIENSILNNIFQEHDNLKSTKDNKPHLQHEKIYAVSQMVTIAISEFE